MLHNGNQWPLIDLIKRKSDAKQGDREAKRENERERQHRARERRKTLFDQLRERGIVPDFDATTAQLEAELSRVTNADRHANVTPPVTRTDTANQTPDTRHQTPVLNSKAMETPSNPLGTDGALSPGEVCKAMREAGISRVNPSNPILHRLIAEGATLSEFVDAVPGSLSDHVKSPFSHALGTVEGRRKEAAIRASTGGTLRDRERADTTHTLAGGLISDQATKLRKDATHGRTIDGEAKRVD